MTKWAIFVTYTTSCRKILGTWNLKKRVVFFFKSMIYYIELVGRLRERGGVITWQNS